MTISQSRKVLGKLAQNISDETLKAEIGLATFLKDFYFSDPRHFSSEKLGELRKVYRDKYPFKPCGATAILEVMS